MTRSRLYPRSAFPFCGSALSVSFNGMDKVYFTCVLFIALWKTYCETPLQNCPKIEFVDNISKDNVVVVEENCYVNVSLYVNTDGCDDNKQEWLLKIVRVEGELVLDECKIPLQNSICQQSMREQPTCSCLFKDQLVVQFRRTFSGSDYKVYDWMLTNIQTTTAVRLQRIYFVIRKSTIKNNCKNTTRSEVKADGVCFCSCLQAVIGSCVCVAAVIAITLVCIARRHCKTRGPSSIKYRVS